MSFAQSGRLFDVAERSWRTRSAFRWPPRVHYIDYRLRCASARFLALYLWLRGVTLDDLRRCWCSPCG